MKSSNGNQSDTDIVHFDCKQDHQKEFCQKVFFLNLGFKRYPACFTFAAV
jgi:hypothetical protein